MAVKAQSPVSIEQSLDQLIKEIRESKEEIIREIRNATERIRRDVAIQRIERLKHHADLA